MSMNAGANNDGLKLCCDLSGDRFLVLGSGTMLAACVPGNVGVHLIFGHNGEKCVCMLGSSDTLIEMQLSITLLPLPVSTLKLSFCRQCACLLPPCHRSTGLSLLPLCHRCAHSSSDIHSVASAHSVSPPLSPVYRAVMPSYYWHFQK